MFGLGARYRLIEKEAYKYGLFIIEDAAQGLGGIIKGKKSGSFGDVASTSFFPAKPLGCYGDGGAIFTNDDKIAKVMKSIRVHGSGTDKYDNVRVGINGRLDTIQAAILLEKLDIFDHELTLRNNIANYYKDNLKGKFKTPFVPKNYQSSWAQFSLMADSSDTRKKILNNMKDKNIPAIIYYKTPLHLQSVFSYLGYKIGSFPVSEKYRKEFFNSHASIFKAK